MAKLTDEQIKVYGDPEEIEHLIPFEYPDGEEYPAVIMLSSHWCRKEFYAKWTELNGCDFNSGYEIGYDKFIEDMKKAAKDGEATEADILLFDYIISEKGAEDFFGVGNY